MKKIIWLLAVVMLTIACKNEKKEAAINFTISGNIKGLKKGTVYLKRIKDTSFTPLDSITLYNTSEFTLQTALEEPEALYLYLDKQDNNNYNDYLAFFAEPGTMTIHTTVQKFRRNAKITGGKNQAKLNEYQAIKKRFDIENLRLMNVNYEAQKQNDISKLEETKLGFKNNAIRKYLYTVNFAVNNKNLEVAPYILLSEIPDANIKYLDTVSKTLDPKIKKSKYGKELKRHIQLKKDALEKKAKK